MPDTNVKPAFLDLVAAAKRTRDRLLEREHWLDSKAIARAMRHEALVSDPGLVIAAATEDFIHNDSEGTAAMP